MLLVLIKEVLLFSWCRFLSSVMFSFCLFLSFFLPSLYMSLYNHHPKQTGSSSLLCPLTVHTERWLQENRKNRKSEPQHEKTNKMTCAQRRLRSAWASAQPDQSLRCLLEETLGLWLPIERTAKTLNRLCRCAGLSESSLGAPFVGFVVVWLINRM